MLASVRVLCGLALSLVLCGIAAAANDAELDGVRFEEQVRLEPGLRPLTLSGAGVHRKFGIKVYAIGLYLSERSTRPEQILSSKNPKRVAISVLMKEITADQFLGSLREKLESDLTPDEYKALQASIAQINEIVSEVKVLKRGQVIALDYIPGSGTRVMINNEVKGSYIAGDAFYHALLAGWIGPKPVSRGLKRALLAQDIAER